MYTFLKKLRHCECTKKYIYIYYIYTYIWMPTLVQSPFSDLFKIRQKFIPQSIILGSKEVYGWFLESGFLGKDSSQSLEWLRVISGWNSRISFQDVVCLSVCLFLKPKAGTKYKSNQHLHPLFHPRDRKIPPLACLTGNIAILHGTGYSFSWLKTATVSPWPVPYH